jgi:hypothetical protein
MTQVGISALAAKREGLVMVRAANPALVQLPRLFHSSIPTRPKSMAGSLSWTEQSTRGREQAAQAKLCVSPTFPFGMRTTFH